MAVDHRHCFVVGLGSDDAEHGPEDLLAVDPHLGGHMVEEGHAQEVAVRVFGHVEGSPVVDQLRPFGHAFVDPFDYGGAVLGRVDGTHVHVRLHACADPELADPLVHERQQPVCGVADGDDQSLGHAALAG